ncbi:hypothetical protein Bca52824_022480 [Brassica carinata]|uniref:Uncharacterized protein n=1 Tax=Brassica carinata TaxID=52824 RepID=A0A8X7VG48_BRACI|nr:hypothetical protein Bca52824_022480 [Brassica carinata]
MAKEDISWSEAMGTLPAVEDTSSEEGELTMGQDFSYSQPSSSEFDTTSLLLAEAELYAAEVESDYRRSSGDLNQHFFIASLIMARCRTRESRSRANVKLVV